MTPPVETILSSILTLVTGLPVLYSTVADKQSRCVTFAPVLIKAVKTSGAMDAQRLHTGNSSSPDLIHLAFTGVTALKVHFMRSYSTNGSDF